MSLILQAPLPTIQTTTLLPSPQFGDSETPQGSVESMRSTTGVLYTYVKSNARSKLNYTLTLSRMKALELRAFIQAYYRALVRVINHKGETWECYFTANPFDFSTDSRAGGQPGGESVTIILELEGVKVS